MIRRIGLVVALVAAHLVAVSASQATESGVPRLRPGQHVYWRSGSSHQVDVLPGGTTLRASVDIPACCGAAVEAVGPDGEVVTSGSGFLSAEVYVDQPEPGRWTVRVPGGRSGARMRAKLETQRDAARPRGAKPLLPNLRLVPPYEFTFSPGIQTPGAPGCNPDDAAEFGCRRGLRFSLGPANTGPGPFQLRFAELEGVVVAGKVYQRVYDGSGAFTEREAGQFEYHKTHQHYHHTGFGSLELLRVDPERRRLTPAGSGPKQGFCTADVVIFDWHRFDQARQNSTASECVNQMLTPLGTYGPLGTLMGVSPGWADIYLWLQDGNYVNFADNPDGRYVVRSTADALGHVLEADESDNTSYAYIEVDGDRVKVLERGFGTGPFDPRKRLATDRVSLNAYR
ncbi:MAG TPA: lysyl oxidase family protein [Mycobacteriales bacterium]|nr:lysyl oxidase family protein [Mycobacteriales bacterium]